jgi:apolipoprotein N-acyltransferase
VIRAVIATFFLAVFAGGAAMLSGQIKHGKLLLVMIYICLLFICLMNILEHAVRNIQELFVLE